uniref:Uncharacterized protein n=1 Tax=Helianthus annuus TaxID=4232 RepID=A0A251V025_HELAN
MYRISSRLCRWLLLFTIYSPIIIPKLDFPFLLNCFLFNVIANHKSYLSSISQWRFTLKHLMMPYQPMVLKGLDFVGLSTRNKQWCLKY